MADSQIHPAQQRNRTVSERIVSRHSFSFGPYYDPGNLGFGVLIVHNEDTISPGGGYPMHPHRDTEIVTWVLSGTLEHTDSGGGRGLTVPGTVQHLSAGAGVQHSELAIAGGGELHLVQMWVRPDTFGDLPVYRQADVEAALSRAELVPVASGLAKHRADAPLRLRQAGAGMSIARVPAGIAVNLPDAAAGHLFVTRGKVMLETDGAAELLHAGDAARLTRPQGEQVRALTDAEIILWELDA